MNHYYPSLIIINHQWSSIDSPIDGNLHLFLDFRGNMISPMLEAELATVMFGSILCPGPVMPWRRLRFTLAVHEGMSWSMVQGGRTPTKTKQLNWAVAAIHPCWLMISLGIILPFNTLHILGIIIIQERGIPINQPELNGMIEGFWSLLNWAQWVKLSKSNSSLSI